MDRFVTRTSTWKTLNYSTMAAQKNSTLTLKSASQPLDNKKMPLQQKQLSEVAKTYDFDKRFDDLFRLNQANVENFNANSNDSGLSSASSISPQQLDENVLSCNANLSKNFLTPTKKYLGKLGDYVDCPTEKENDTYMTIIENKSHKRTESTKNWENFDNIKSLAKKLYATPEKVQHSGGKMIMARIQRDLNSPSAAVRVRALKAIKSPSKSAYSHFDVPEAEQSLLIPELPSLQEIMRNIVVYVEVRSGEDNRSAGVRKVIEALGARVNLNLKSDTTHVVFKDGLISTYKKATQLGVPVVSILWIEACKNQRRICNAKDYPISNLDRYENPELYTKMKRVKSMQPDSECNKRVRAKAAGGGGNTPRDLTPTQKTAGAIKKTSTFNGGTPTSSTNKKKTDISQFFKKLEKPPTTPGANAGCDDAGCTTLPESPATLLLNRINAECYTPLDKWKQKTKANKIEIYDEKNRGDLTHVCGSPNNVTKALDFLKISSVGQTTNDDKLNVANISSANKEKPVNTRRRRSSVATSTAQAILEIGASLTENLQLVTTSSPAKKDNRQRRHSLMPAGELEIATNTINFLAISNTPSRNTRRRSSIYTPKDMTMETPNKINVIQPAILEESNELDTQQPIEKPKAPIKPPRAINLRRTLYGEKTMDQTNVMKIHENETLEAEETSKSTRRRNINGSKTVEKSELKTDTKGGGDDSIISTVPTRRRTEVQTTLEEASTKTIDTLHITNKKTQYSKQIKDLLKYKAKQTSPTTKETNQTQLRRTLYTPQKVNGSEMKKTTKATIGENDASGSCVTPTSFLQGKITSSTLLEDSANRSKLLVATPPPTDVTVGKLLEETADCATPLIFSSTRQPSNKRRTLFDVSMDIITQRLQCINQSARRSLAPTPSNSNSNNAIPADVNVQNTPMEELKNSKQLENNNNTDIAASYTLVTESKLHDVVPTATLTPEIAPVKRKRKLFMTNEMLLLTPPPAPSNAKTTTDESEKIPTLLTTTSSLYSVTKRRRTLMPISQPQPNIMVAFKEGDITTATTTTPKGRKRRSTLDFEQIQNIKTKTNNKITTLYKNKKTEFAFDSSASTSSSSTEIKEKTATTTLNTDVAKTTKPPVLVYTNMHSQQIDVIREAVNSLGIFTLESCVTDSTTHLVSLEPRRTLNLLRALVRGLWIVEYSWIMESIKARKWLPEEPYELRDFSRSIEICRSERQAFGEHYKCELFRKIGSFYIAFLYSPISKEDLCELVRLCGGHIVSTRQKARYIIGDPTPNLKNKFYLTPFWVLDSISQMQIMKIKKYSYHCPVKNSQQLQK